VVTPDTGAGRDDHRPSKLTACTTTERVPVTKRLIDHDDESLARAQRERNTTGVSDTVRAALRQAASAAARARQVAWLCEGGLETMADPGRRADVWR
jgi:Arc/MetJ family transcription regulator